MTGKTCGWRRFWCPRDSQIDPLEGGFPPDPEWLVWRLEGLDMYPLESLAETPCLVLLGEPGFGKIFALKAEYAATVEGVDVEDDQALWPDPSPYASKDRLGWNPFESPEFSAWASGTHRLCDPAGALADTYCH